MNFSNPVDYKSHLNQKIKEFEKRLKKFYSGGIAVFASSPEKFRMRAEFRIYNDDNESHYAMTQPGTTRPFIVKTFPIGAAPIQQLMPKLLSEINREIVIREKLFAVEFLTTLSGQALITLIYHKKLDSEWENKARQLQSNIRASIIGRSRKQKLVLDKDHVIEKFKVGGKVLSYLQVESGFTQPNARINEKMLSWAQAVCDKSSGDLLEIYCGNGNFTIALAHRFGKVLAVENSKLSLRAARHNAALNDIKNITFVRMSSEEIAQAIDFIRSFRRLKYVGLEDFAFATIFVDPPRSGLDPSTLALVIRYRRIIYFSCNPTSLFADLEQILPTHEIKSLAIFDQFPWTEHLEIGLLLELR